MENKLFESDRNIYLCSPGGYGKSHLIRAYIELCKEHKIIYASTAATGVAAINVNGTTLHSFFGCGLANGNAQKVLNKVRTRSEAKKRIIDTEVLIIDEISMVGQELFEKLDYVAKSLRKNTKPFGGMRLIVSGDFLQLSPINEEYIFKSQIWKDLNFKVIKLKKPWRFTDENFLEMLNRIRFGEQTEEDIEKLYSKVSDYKKYINGDAKTDKIKPTIIFSHRKDVLETNLNRLEKLPGKAKTYLAADTKGDRVITEDEYNDILEQITPKELTLKVNAQVMLTKNLDLDAGLCNGSRGVVTKLSEDSVRVLFKNGIEISIPVYPMETEINGEKITRTQIPLILAYALTVHKIQGSTIDFCVMDLGTSIFCAGQAYVALSRVRSWDGLLLTSFIPSSIIVDKDAVDFIKSI